MRNLPPAMAQALTAAQNGQGMNPAFLCELDLGYHILQCWSGRGELEWKGRRFGGPKLIQQVIGGVSNIEESGEAKATGLAFYVSGIDRESGPGRSLIRIAQSQVRRGGLCVLWFAVLDDAGALAGEPFEISNTYVDFPLIQVKATGITVMLQTETKRVRHRSRPGRRATHEDHQIDHPGDMIYQYKNELQDKTI